MKVSTKPNSHSSIAVSHETMYILYITGARLMGSWTVCHTVRDTC